MQLPTPPGWGQWQQNDVETSYVHMDTPMMGTQAPLQQPTMASHYPVPMATTSSLQQPMSYAPYHASLPAVAPLQMPTMGPQHHQPQHHHHQHRHPHHSQYEDQHPSRPRRKLVDTRGLKSGSRDSIDLIYRTRSTPEKPGRRVPKTIVANAPAEGADHVGNHVEFHTSIDKLMKVIQAMPTTATLVESIESEVKQESARMEVTETGASPIDDAQLSGEKSTVRKFACHFRRCQKKFAQKAQLDTHVRSHTGERPFVCEWPSCGKRFSQSGNLHTHERKHTGEKPYACEICGRKFAQGGNRQAHMKVHQKNKDFICRLENCGKEFTQRGNLKNHQNKTHQAYMDRSMARLEGMDPETMTPEDRELITYLAPLYKNSNKGIKGRGTRPPGYTLSRSERSSSMSSSAHSYTPSSSEVGSTPSPSTSGPPHHQQHHYGGPAQHQHQQPHHHSHQPHHHQHPHHHHQHQQDHHHGVPSYHVLTSAPAQHQQPRSHHSLAYPPVSFGSAPTGNIRYPFNGILHHYDMSSSGQHHHGYGGVPVTSSSSTSSPVATVYSDDSNAVYHSDENGARELGFGERMC